jgi:DNA-binding response OmpR family regulator
MNKVMTLTKPDTPAQQHTRRILVVEDNREAHHTLAELLQGEGHRVISAYDGISGLCMARAGDIDVLICDIGLPGLDGLQLLGQLRMTAGACVPFAIAISGDDAPLARNAAIGAGYGQYLVKPINVQGLLALIASDMVDRFVTGAAQGEQGRR